MFSVLKALYRVFRCIRETVVSLFFILFVMAFFALSSLLVSEPTPDAASVKPAALRLDLDGYLADNRDELSDFHRFLQSELGGEAPLKLSTFDVVRTIAKAADDDNITGIVLDLSHFEGGDLPSLQFVGRALNDFRQSGKPIIAVGDLYTQKQYYLASFAQKIYLNKAGMVELVGLSYTNLYFKSLFEKIDAVPHVFRVGTYKSAVEPFLRDDMSREARENASSWLNGLWQEMRDEMAKNRGVPTDKWLPDGADYLTQFRAAKGDHAQFALNQGWVSELLTAAEMTKRLAEQFGEDPEKGYRYMDYLDYAAMLSDRFHVNAPHKIAVVNVEGQIVWGSGGEGQTGSDEIVKLLTEARQDAQVEGVILRVNSPGGSAVGAELIRQAVEDLQTSGKPVVVSMGGMAASGGYWIAATADHIVAAPTTLTGSIGIFGLAMDFEKTAKRLGISQDGVATSSLAEESGLKALNSAQAAIIQISIEQGYERFLDLVAKGRKMSFEEVDKLAQGQVWLGKTAFEKGLVDQLGDFDDAYRAIKEKINQKRQAANLPSLTQMVTEWRVDYSEDMLSQFMRGFKLSSPMDLTSLFGKPLHSVWHKSQETLTRFNDPKQLYLYCLNCGEIK